ncbi:MAG: hypothetical protein E7182_03825 [Erysipelotrichaceae bacterium]|nr:hypothetical protein [Erysipelotrichaceae bacterium]
MFKRGSIVMTIWNLIVAAGLIALGIATCVNNGNQDFRNVMIMIAGIFVIVDAGLRILTQVIQVVRFQHGVMVRTDLASAVTGASELAVGILLIMVSQNSTDMIVVLQYLILFVSILLITLGGVDIIYSIVFLVKKVGSLARNIFSLIFGALVVTGGVLILVYATNEGMLQFIFVLFGIGFILSGIGVLILAIAFAVAARRASKVEKGDKPESVEVKPEEEEPKAEEPEEPMAEEEKPEEPSEEKPEEPKAE